MERNKDDFHAFGKWVAFLQQSKPRARPEAKNKPAFQERGTHGCVMRSKLAKGPWMRCLSSWAQRRPPATEGMFLWTEENPGGTAQPGWMKGGPRLPALLCPGSPATSQSTFCLICLHMLKSPLLTLSCGVPGEPLCSVKEQKEWPWGQHETGSEDRGTSPALPLTGFLTLHQWFSTWLHICIPWWMGGQGGRGSLKMLVPGPCLPHLMSLVWAGISHMYLVKALKRILIVQSGLRNSALTDNLTSLGLSCCFF